MFDYILTSSLLQIKENKKVIGSKYNKTIEQGNQPVVHTDRKRWQNNKQKNKYQNHVCFLGTHLVLSPPLILRVLEHCIRTVYIQIYTAQLYPTVQS